MEGFALNPVNTWASVIATEEITGGAHWKHLWKPVRDTETPVVKLAAASIITVNHPVIETDTSTRVHVATPFITARAGATVRPERPGTTLITFPVGTRGSLRANVAFPGTSTTVYPVGAALETFASSGRATPTASASVQPVSTHGRAYYSYWEPVTIQNLEPEVAYFL